ncbi:MAG: hypothetical protein JO336_14765, partial [Acidobacteriia bacterium]|nr:hypothetical protein [Terriglobia bacterium]
TSTLQSQVQVYSIQKQTFLPAITTDQLPLSAALSRDGKSLYVTCYGASTLDVIDLTQLAVTGSVELPSKPEGVAVASDGRVLISSTGSGTNGANNVLLLYNPAPGATQILTSISTAPPAPAAPTLPPPPPGRPFLSTHSVLAATMDGSLIAGVNVPATGPPAVFVYEAASGTVLRSRILAGSSTALAFSADGTRLASGTNLFDAATLHVLAQTNIANASFGIAPGSNFNLASAQGGGVFAPNGQTLYQAFDFAPASNPTSTTTTGQLMLTDPDNLLLRTGLQMPENLAGKMVISSDGNSIYALSDSGFVIVPAGSITANPLAVPSAAAVVVTNDQCGVSAQTASAAVSITNAGKGRLSASAQPFQLATGAGAPPPTAAPTVKTGVDSNGNPQLQFTYNPAAAARGLGTVTPPNDFLIQSPEAITLAPRVRVYQNNRDAEVNGMIVPLAGGQVSGEAFPDLLYDQTRQRIYIANAGWNRIEVYDIGQQALLAPIKVGQLPTSLALTPDGTTLYVANSGGESISVVDPNLMQTTGTVAFPPIPFNSTLPLVTPNVIAASQNGPMVLMNTGALWNVVGNTAVPRGVSALLGQTSTGLPTPITGASPLVATPDGQYILMVAASTGFVYLYQASVDDWVASRQVFTPSTVTGYIGPVAAGPKGAYYVVNGILLNQALVPSSGGNSVPGPASRLVSAAAASGNGRFAIFSPAPSTNGAVPAPIIEILDANTGNVVSQVEALEGPITQVAANARASISGRTMAIDAAGANAYVITTSGLSIIPLAAVSAPNRPQINPGGAVNLASYRLPVA